MIPNANNGSEEFYMYIHEIKNNCFLSLDADSYRANIWLELTIANFFLT